MEHKEPRGSVAVRKIGEDVVPRASEEAAEDPMRYGLASPCSDTMDVIESLIDRDGDLITHKMAWHWASAMKYLMRWPRKGRADDLRKCVDYIGMLVDDVEEGAE